MEPDNYYLSSHDIEHLEVRVAQDFLQECIHTLSDKRLLWLTDEAMKIYSYENKGKKS